MYIPHWNGRIDMGPSTNGNTDRNGTSNGVGWRYSITGNIVNLRREGANVCFTISSTASSTYAGSAVPVGQSGSGYGINIDGTLVGTAWKSANGGSTSGSKDLTIFCPGAFSSTSYQVRFLCTELQTAGSHWVYTYPVVGSVAPMIVSITLDPNGGSGVETNGGGVEYGSTFSGLPTPTRIGYKFLGWYTEQNDGFRIDDSTVCTFTDSTKTLYARWELQTVFHLIQNGSETLAPVAYIVENEQATQAVGLYVVENETAYQCV